MASQYGRRESRFQEKNQSFASANDVDPIGIDNTSIFEPKKASILSKMPALWVIGLIVCGAAFVGILCAVIFGMGLNQVPVPTTTTPATTSSRSTNQFIGQTCTASSDCIASAYCDSATKTCQCSPQYYYESSVSACITRNTYSQSCSTNDECDLNALLMCTNSICQCDSMLFWNTNTRQCEDKRGLGESCLGMSNECAASKMTCRSINGSTLNRCLCPTSMYFSFNTGDCENKKGYGTQCYANFECADYAWCSSFPSESISRCQCIPSYYWDVTTQACYPKKTYLSSCNNDFECIDNVQSLVCVSNQCSCPTNSAWNGTACDFFKPYLGGPCTSTANCLYKTTVCQWSPERGESMCACPTGTYFTLTNNSCIAYKTLGAVCTDTTQCNVNATCLFQSTTSDMRCQCTVSAYYQSSTNLCLLQKNINDTCSADQECSTVQGLVCVSGYCQCDSNNFWNGANCETKKTYNSYLQSQWCNSIYECRSSLGLTNCVAGRCQCSYPKSWSSAANMCV